MSRKVEVCEKCQVPQLGDLHTNEACLEVQLRQARAEIKKLKQSVLDWKEAWFELREIIGRLGWECHDPQHKEKQT